MPEPVSLVEAKAHLRVGLDEEDDLISALIVTAREHVENVTGRQLVTAAKELTLSGFDVRDDCLILLPYPPLQSVDTITYIDTGGDEQTLAANKYQVDMTVEPAELLPAWGESWPATRCQFGSVTIAYTAGYGDAADVPAAIKAAMLLIVGNLYENREDAVIDTIVGKIGAVDSLLRPYVIRDQRLLEFV